MPLSTVRMQNLSTSCKGISDAYQLRASMFCVTGSERVASGELVNAAPPHAGAQTSAGRPPPRGRPPADAPLRPLSGVLSVLPALRRAAEHPQPPDDASAVPAAAWGLPALAAPLASLQLIPCWAVAAALAAPAESAQFRQSDFTVSQW